VLEYRMSNGRCPTGFDELGVPPPDLDVTLVSLGEDRCVIEIGLEGLHASSALADRRLYLTLDEDGAVSCSSDLEQAKYLPSGCR
jgi:hypothetical protein